MNSINVNKSDKQALRSINGIGDVIASHIIDAREKRTFSDEQDLVSRVAGITDKLLSRIKRNNS